MEQLRVVDTPDGAVTYTLVRKRVKNLNLRIGREGTVILSVPPACPVDQADRMIREKSAWIIKALRRLAAPPPGLLPDPGREECRLRLSAALDQAYPLAEPLGVRYPELKLRKMKSQWGNCHWSQGYITLNTALARCPERLRVYVALHELVHFLHPDHGPGFYAVMDALMPDWKACRRELKQYAAALEQ